MTNRQIAGRLCVTVHAVKFHLASIYRKLGVNNRTEAVVAFLQANGELKPASLAHRGSESLLPCPLALPADRCHRVRPRNHSRLRKRRQGRRGRIYLLPTTADVAGHDASLRDAARLPMGPHGSSGGSDVGTVDLDIFGTPVRRSNSPGLPGAVLRSTYQRRPDPAPDPKERPAEDRFDRCGGDGPGDEQSIGAGRRDGRRPYVCSGRRAVSQEGANLFRSYIADQQASAGIPLKQRVLLQVVSTKAAVIKGRKKTLAIVAFLAVLIATIALTFVLENHRPRIQAVAPVTAAAPAERVDVRKTGS